MPITAHHAPIRVRQITHKITSPTLRRILESIILHIRLIQPIMLDRHLILKRRGAGDIFAVADEAVRQDEQDGHDVADNHGDGAARVGGRLVLAERLGADDVADGPGDVVPGEQRHLFRVARHVGLVDGHERHVGGPVRVQDVEAHELAGEVGPGQGVAEDGAQEGEQDGASHQRGPPPPRRGREVRERDARGRGHEPGRHGEQRRVQAVEAQPGDDEGVEGGEAAVGDLQGHDAEPDEPRLDIRHGLPDLLGLELFRLEARVVGRLALDDYVLFAAGEPAGVQGVVGTARGGLVFRAFYID